MGGGPGNLPLASRPVLLQFEEFRTNEEETRLLLKAWEYESMGVWEYGGIRKIFHTSGMGNTCIAPTLPLHSHTPTLPYSYPLRGLYCPLPTTYGSLSFVSRLTFSQTNPSPMRLYHFRDLSYFSNSFQTFLSQKLSSHTNSSTFF